MRPSCGLALLLTGVLAGELQGQAQFTGSSIPGASVWVPRPVPRALAFTSMFTVQSDSTRSRPFFLPRPGEHTAYWVGFGAGLALSPLLWCEGSGCGVVDKASTSLLLGCAGAVTGLLLSRTF